MFAFNIFDETIRGGYCIKTQQQQTKLSCTDTKIFLL